MTALAVLLAAAAAALLARGGLPSAAAPRGAAMRLTGSPARLGVLAAAAGAFALAGSHLVLVLLLLGGSAGVVAMVRAERRRRAAVRVRALVVETCEALQGELRAGQPPLTCLERCVEVWPGFEPVAAAARLGADVPAALRRLAESDGAEALGEVGAAWQVAVRSGSGLALALDRVTASVRARQNTSHLVLAELSSARATARLVAVLPFGSLAMTAGVGGDPWHFLLATPAGLACLGVGVALVFAGLWWIERIAAAVVDQ